MATHGKHEGPDHILYDNCPRCEQHAEDPFKDLDGRSLDALILIAQRTYGQNGRMMDMMSDNEIVAVRNIHRVLNDTKRVYKVIGMVPLAEILDA